jgi:hypothetical protein
VAAVGTADSATTAANTGSVNRDRARRSLDLDIHLSCQSTHIAGLVSGERGPDDGGLGTAAIENVHVFRSDVSSFEEFAAFADVGGSISPTPAAPRAS